MDFVLTPDGTQLRPAHCGRVGGEGWSQKHMLVSNDSRSWATRAGILVSIVIATAVAFPIDVAGYSSPLEEKGSDSPVMLILRGIPSPDYPRGQLDDDSALEYARRVGYQGEVIDAAGNS